MSVFSAIGDFFRSPFESDEEKKQRKLREAQAAQAKAAQAQQAKSQPQPTQPKAQNVTDLFGAKPTNQPLGVKPQLQQAKPAPQPPTVAPRVTPPAPPAPLDANGKIDFTKLKATPQNVPIQPGSAQDKVNKTIDTIASSAARVGTGIAQSGAGLYDLITPGKGTNRVSKSLNQSAQEIDQYAKEHGNNTGYKVGNVVGEIASYAIPTKAAATIAKLVPKATKLTDATAESVAGLIDHQGAANSVRQWLGEGVRRGMTMEDLLANQAISSKYIGENASKGRDTNPVSLAADAALGTAASAGTRLAGDVTGRVLHGAHNAEDIIGDAAGSGASGATSEAVREGGDAVKRATNKVSVHEEKKALDHASTQRVLTPEEQARRAELANVPTKPVTDAEHQANVKNASDAVQERTDKYIADHPDLTPEQTKIVREAAQKRIDTLVSDLEDSHAANKEAINKLVDEHKAAETAGEANAAEAAAAHTAETSPNPATVVEGKTQPGSAEAAANDGYQPPTQSTDEVLHGDQAAVQERGRLTLPQLLSPDRAIRENVTRPLEAAANRGVEALQTSDNKVLQGVGRLFTGVSREAGIAPETQTARMQLRGGVETGKLNREAIADLSKGFEDKSLNRVWATLDPEFAQRAGMEVPGNLTPAETELQGKLKTVIDNTTQENLRRGLITPEQAASESYIKRSYSIYDGNTEAGKFERGFRQELLGQYKGRKQVSDEMVDLAIKDPTYLVGKKTAESEAMWAMQDYGNYLSKSGTVSDVAKVGYTQLPDSPVFGEAAGKFVPRNLAEDFTGFQYNHAMVSAWNDLITGYDRLGIRQAKKQLLTIFNPAVRLGNQVTNRAIFSQLGGINPLQFNAAYAQVGKEIATSSPLYREAVSQGLTGIDITQADFFAKRIAQAGEDPNLAQKAMNWVKTSYSEADDKARVAAYVVKRSQGYTAEEAARQVQRSFQDYKSVGFFYDMAAKTPVIGNAFVRFAADSVRIAKNAALDHPLRSMATIAAWSTFVNGMSVVSGESNLEGDSPQEKAFNLVTGKSKSALQKDREGRFGAPKIPFTDISTAVQTPWGEVNVARFMPWYQLNDISGSQVSKFLPFQNSPVTMVNGKPTINGAGLNDPLLGQFAQVAIDKDFRNKSISDPTNTGDKYAQDPLSGDQKRNNVLRFLFANNAPVGKEIDQTASAAKGQPDIFGKDRTVPQALLRDFGLKIEQQGAAEAKTRQDTKAYFDEKAQIDKDVAGMSPAAQEAYKRLTGYYKLREQVPNEFKPGDTRDKKAPQYNFSEDKWKELAAHPELYDLLAKKKQQDAANKGVPLQPEYDPRLSEGFRKQLIQNKMVAPGDDAELDQRMYSQPEWDYYQNLKKQYTEAGKKYYKDNGNKDFTDELVKHQDAKFPDKPMLLKQYSAAYADYLSGKRDKPGFTDAMKALKEDYNHQTLNWTNEARKARGLPAITWDTWNNPTFGFDSTPSSGFGFGGSSNYDPSLHVNNLGHLSNLSAGISAPPAGTASANTMPNIVQIFNQLMAGNGRPRSARALSMQAKPPLGASASGR